MRSLGNNIRLGSTNQLPTRISHTLLKRQHAFPNSTGAGVRQATSTSSKRAAMSLYNLNRALSGIQTNHVEGSTMLTRYSEPFIFDNLIKMAPFCSDNKIPSIQGYYAHYETSTTDKQGIQDIMTHEQILNSLKLRAGLEIVIIIELAWYIPSTPYSALKQRLQSQGWQLQE